MEIEKINDNKIKVFINKNFLKKHSISITDRDLNAPKFQTIFLEILNKAEQEINFDTEGYKLLFELYYQEDESIVFMITKYKNKNMITSAKNDLYKIYNFEDFNDFYNFYIELLKRKDFNKCYKDICFNSKIYHYKNTYYLLIFLNKNLKNNFKKFESLLLEFIDKCPSSDFFIYKLKEYGIPINKTLF